MALPLSGRTAVVTGASRGIGAATTRALAGAGARVALVARSAGELEELAGTVGREAFAVPADLADTAALERAVANIRARLGADPDILVNNAGIFRVMPLAEMPADLFSRTMELNLVVPFRLMRAFVPGMLRRGSGHIVNIGSVADRHAFPENTAYSASKYGLRGLHEVLRAELRGTGVRTSLISPGAVDTDLWNEAAPAAAPDRFPPRDEMLTADSVAAAVLYAVTQPPAVNVEELRLRRS